MAKEKQWEDVRLLSFDLQTVEFIYASVRITLSSCILFSCAIQDYTLSISCQDQLLTGGSYNLHFGRLPSQDEAHNHRPNPHEKAELFLHALLRQGRLADALPALVSVLRDTVPVLEVLTRIPARAVPKAAGWWRVMFNPSGNTGTHLTFACSRAHGWRYLMHQSRSSAMHRSSSNRRRVSRGRQTPWWGFVQFLGSTKQLPRLWRQGAGAGLLLGSILALYAVRRM
jgi:hypothetical protein